MPCCRSPHAVISPITCARHPAAPVAGLIGCQIHGRSLRGVGWDYDLHPRFAAYCAGVLFVPGRLTTGPTGPYDWRPGESQVVNNDPALEAEFPPRFLPGLESDLCWRPD
jgi:hypothetical protein